MLGIIGQPLFEAAAQTFIGAIAGYSFDKIKDHFYKENTFDGAFDLWQRGIRHKAIQAGDRLAFDGLISPYVQLFPRDPYTNAVRWNKLHNFEGKIQVGEIIVNTRLAEEFIEIFKEFFSIQYQIRSMYLVDNYWQESGDPDDADTASIDADNTSAFSYRVITYGTTLSRHAYGCAIDLNPLENPYATISEDGSYYTIHEESRQYLYNRSSEMPHVITHEDPAYRIFVIEHGFTWGGDWESVVDYQHFEKMVQ